MLFDAVGRAVFGCARASEGIEEQDSSRGEQLAEKGGIAPPARFIKGDQRRSVPHEIKEPSRSRVPSKTSPTRKRQFSLWYAV